MAQNKEFLSLYSKIEVINEDFTNGKLTTVNTLLEFRKIQNQTKTKYPDLAINTYTYTAATMLYAGKTFEAIAEYKAGLRASEILVGTSKDSIQFKLYADLGANYRKSQDLDSAKICFEKCFEIYARNPVIKEKLKLYLFAYFYNYGMYYQQIFDYQASNYYFNAALEIDKKKTFINSHSFVQEALAQNFIETKEYSKAIVLLRAAINPKERGENIANKYLKISALELTQGNNPSALAAIKMAQKAFVASDFKQAGAVFPAVEMRIALAYAQYYGKLNQNDLAEQAYRKVLAINQKYSQTEKGIFVAEALVGLGKLLADESYFERAGRAAGLSEDLNGLVSPQWLLESQLAKAKLQGSKNLATATAAYLQAIQTATKVRKGFNFTESKVFYAEKVFPIYEETLAFLNKNGKITSPENFANVIEYSHAATLTDALQMQQVKPSPKAAKLLEAEKALVAERNKLSIKNQSTKETGLNADNTNKINDINLKIAREDPAFYEFKHKTEIAKTATIQAVLDSKTAMISYLLGKKYLYVSIITKDQLQVASLPIDSSFLNNLKNFLKELYTMPAIEDYNDHGLASKLYKQLIAPIEPYLKNKNRLVILRDAELNFLPFEILEKQSEHPLFKDYAISYTYSATIWQQAIQLKNQQSASILAFAPYTSQATLPPSFRDDFLKPLPASKQEVQQIGGTIYQDNTATKNQFLENYRQHGIVHFATHAQIDDFDPNNSFLAFYPDGADYKLFTNEIYNLSLQNTRLIVLSACEAGRGKLNRGEGVMSLARAFAYAGCPSVITTLWNAQDRSTAFLSERLHEHIKAGEPLDIALQNARIDYFNAPIGKELDHPYYWANFVLIGNYQPIVQQSYWLWVLVFSAIVSMITIYFWMKRNRQ
jgi:CHAT domain-containing protein